MIPLGELDPAWWVAIVPCAIGLAFVVRAWWLAGVWRRLDRVASAIERVASASEGRPDARVACSRCGTRLDDDANACAKCGLMRVAQAPAR